MIDAQEDLTFEDEVEERLPANLLPGEIVLGTLSGIDSEGIPHISYSGNPVERPVGAITSVALTRQHIGRQLAILFIEGDPYRPLIVGLIYQPLLAILESFSESQSNNPELEYTSDRDDLAGVDGERIVIEGKKEVVLKCGDASITLTQAGKVIIKGKYVLTRSTGVNRIQGGSVQVN